MAASSRLAGGPTANGEAEGGFEELTEAPDLAGDNRVVLNIHIPRAELVTSPASASSAGEGQHSVYCVVYDGLYLAVAHSTKVLLFFFVSRFTGFYWVLLGFTLVY